MWKTLSLWTVAMMLGAQVPDAKVQRAAPEQPLPFSHQKHAGELKLPCKGCHTMPEPGDFATFPATKVCMGCHVAVKKESAAIQKLAAFDTEGKRIPWARVYRIADYVFFNHQVHVSVEGVTCGTCHGPVAEREVMRREKELSMQTCMECHRLKQAKNECTFCHEQK